MGISIGGVLGISYSDAKNIDKPKVIRALKNLNYTEEAAHAVMRSLLEGETRETGFTFNGDTTHLDAFLRELGENSGVKIEIHHRPPTPEFAKKMKELWASI